MWCQLQGGSLCWGSSEMPRSTADELPGGGLQACRAGAHRPRAGWELRLGRGRGAGCRMLAVQRGMSLQETPRKLRDADGWGAFRQGHRCGPGLSSAAPADPWEGDSHLTGQQGPSLGSQAPRRCCCPRPRRQVRALRIGQGEGRRGSAWPPGVGRRACQCERVDLDHREMGTPATPWGQGRGAAST